MTQMSTSLTEFSTAGNTRTYTAPGHTTLAPRLLIQKRKLAANADGVAETTLKVVYGLTKSDGSPVAQKVTYEVVGRSPLIGIGSAANTGALALLRDLVNSDEFESAFLTQNWVQ